MPEHTTIAAQTSSGPSRFSTSPQDHPTFRRAIDFARQRMLSDPQGLARRLAVAALLAGEDSDSAHRAALSQAARETFDDAVEQLWSECSRRVEIEYEMDGATWLSDAADRLSRAPDEALCELSDALSRNVASAPGMARFHLELGAREDGLLFGKLRQSALEGSFDELREAVAADSYDALISAPWALPSDQEGVDGRPVALGAAELAERLRTLPLVQFRADTESWHTLPGEQAAERVLQIAEQADAERPNAAALSRFFTRLGL